MRGLGPVQPLQHDRVALEVGALADDHALDAEVAQGLQPLVVAEVGLPEFLGKTMGTPTPM